MFDKPGRLSPEDQTVLVEEILEPLTRPETFDVLTRSTERLCERIIEAAGGTPSRPHASTPGLHTACGYFIPGRDDGEPVAAPGSELHYALRVLWFLRFSRSRDIDEARRFAWQAGALAMEASMKFRWEQHALRGEKALDDARQAARKRRDEGEAEGARLTRRFEALRAQSDESTDAMIYQRIGRSEKRSVASVARKIQRYRKDLR
jgi:hypothetical protein